MIGNTDARQEQERRTTGAPTRRLALEQHMELRHLLAAGIREVYSRLERQAPPRESLGRLIGKIRDTFVQHIADEEAVLLPMFEDEARGGSLRASELRGEHARLRAEIETLCAWPADAADLELAVRFDRLARGLLRQIADEERQYLIRRPIRDRGVVAAQLPG
jgi:hypothetical protein